MVVVSEVAPSEYWHDDELLLLKFDELARSACGVVELALDLFDSGVLVVDDETDLLLLLDELVLAPLAADLFAAARLCRLFDLSASTFESL